MFLFDVFRSFLPLHNSIGFGPADFIELALAAMLVFDGAGVASLDSAVRSQTGGEDRLVDAAAGPAAGGASAGPAGAPSGRPRRTFTTSSATCFRPTRCGTSAWPIRRIRCRSSSRRSLCCKSQPTVPSTRWARAWRWRSDGPCLAFPGPGWCFPWRPSARCATGCCGPGPRRGGRSRAGRWR
jgi:hypothetical protein